MSRSGYCDDIEDPLELGRWRAQVRSATRGKRGQKLLRDLLAALDAMPDKRLVANQLEVSAASDEKHAQSWVAMFNDPGAADRHREHYVATRPAHYHEGDVCALGALGRVRGLDMSGLDPDDPEGVGAAFDIATPLAQEIVYVNDEGFFARTVTMAHGQEYYLRVECPAERWQRVRNWVAAQIIQSTDQPRG